MTSRRAALLSILLGAAAAAHAEPVGQGGGWRELGAFAAFLILAPPTVLLMIASFVYGESATRERWIAELALPVLATSAGFAVDSTIGCWVLGFCAVLLVAPLLVARAAREFLPEARERRAAGAAIGALASAAMAYWFKSTFASSLDFSWFFFAFVVSIVPSCVWLLAMRDRPATRRVAAAARTIEKRERAVVAAIAASPTGVAARTAVPHGDRVRRGLYTFLAVFVGGAAATGSMIAPLALPFIAMAEGVARMFGTPIEAGDVGAWMPYWLSYGAAPSLLIAAGAAALNTRRAEGVAKPRNPYQA